MTSKCAECGSSDHTFKVCPLFSKVKRLVSKQNYKVERRSQIKQEDLDGFCSSGILLTREREGNKEFLAVKEKRDGKDMWNLVGGKRESLAETPLSTAEREFREETNLEDIEFEVPESYTWIANAKYFLIEVISLNDDFPLNENLKWFDLGDYDKEEFHDFSNKALDLFKSI